MNTNRVILFFAVFTTVFSTGVGAEPKPIRSKIELQSESFSQILTEAIADSVNPKIVRRVGATTYLYRVGSGLECTMTKGVGPRAATRYSCAILPKGGWRRLGEAVYGSGENEAFSLELFTALNVEAESDGDSAIKTIELEQDDQNGGTERNLLSCMKPESKQAKKYLRPTCQLINAL